MNRRDINFQSIYCYSNYARYMQTRFYPFARLLNIVAASRLRVFILHLIGEVVHQFSTDVCGVLLTVNVIGQ